MSEQMESVRPWSTRSPQRWFFAAAALVVSVAVIIAGVSYFAAGTGGLVPVLMIAVAPVLGAVYVWYFGFKRW